MEFRILGPLEVLDEGESIQVAGARQRAVLALLLIRANEVVSTDRLIDELWGETPPEGAANALQAAQNAMRAEPDNVAAHVNAGCTATFATMSMPVQSPPESCGSPAGPTRSVPTRRPAGGRILSG